MKYLNIITSLLTLSFIVVFSTFTIGQNQTISTLADPKKVQKTSILKGFVTIVPTFNNYKYNADSVNIQTKENSINIQPTFSYAKARAKGAFFQVSLTGIKYHRRDDYQENAIPNTNTFITVRGAKTTFFSISTLLEWGIPIAYKETRKSNFFIGWGVGEYFSHISLKPYTTASFPSKITEFSLNLSTIPSWQYHFSQRCFIDIALPYAFVSTVYQHRFYNNPILPSSARRLNDFDLTWNSKNISLRVGLAVKI